MYGSVDRIEEGLAVVIWDDEQSQTFTPEDFESGTLPREGDMVFRTPRGRIAVDIGETTRRFDEAKKRMDKLFGR